MMNNFGTIRDCLESKLQILTQIEANLDIQVRFVTKRKIKGLERLTRELEGLIHILAGIDTQLGKDRQWLQNPELQAIIQAIETKKQAISERGAESVQKAKLEREKITGEIQRTREFKKARRQYANNKYDMNRSGFDHKG
jgi:hypothetical protein